MEQVRYAVRRCAREWRIAKALAKAHPAAAAVTAVSVIAGTAALIANHILKPPRVSTDEPSYQPWLRRAAYWAYLAERSFLWALTRPGLKEIWGGGKQPSANAGAVADLLEAIEAGATPRGTEPCVLLDASVYNRVTPKISNEGSDEALFQLRTFAATKKKLWIVAKATVLPAEKRVDRQDSQEIPRERWAAVRDNGGLHQAWHAAFAALPPVGVGHLPYIITGYMTNVLAFQLGRLDVPIAAFSVRPRNVDAHSQTAVEHTSVGPASSAMDAPLFFWHPVPAPPDPAVPSVPWKMERNDFRQLVHPRPMPAASEALPSTRKRAVVLLLTTNDRAALTDAQLAEIATRVQAPIQSYVRAVCTKSMLHDSEFVGALCGLDTVLNSEDVQQNGADTLVVVQTGPVALSLWLGKMTKRRTHPLNGTDGRALLIVEPRPVAPGGGMSVSYADALVAQADGSLLQF